MKPLAISLPHLILLNLQPYRSVHSITNINPLPRFYAPIVSDLDSETVAEIIVLYQTQMFIGIRIQIYVQTMMGP